MILYVKRLYALFDYVVKKPYDPLEQNNAYQLERVRRKMILEPIDFQGRFVFDDALIKQLGRYLDEKETFLANKLITSFSPSAHEPLILPPPSIGLKLTDALEVVSKKIREIAPQDIKDIPLQDWQRLSSAWREALWEYVGTIQGCTTELFQQLKQIGFERWNKELSTILSGLKDLLFSKMEGALWCIRHLEDLLKEYKKNLANQSASMWPRIKNWFDWRSLLDPTLTTNLERNEKFLNTQSQKFALKHMEYLKLNIKIDEALRKFKGYQALAHLEMNDRETFKMIYRLVKLWKKNQRTKSLPELELVQALKNVIHPDKAVGLFKEYYEELLSSLYERSRLIKEGNYLQANDPIGRALVQEVVSGYRSETHTLGAVVSKYREFLLRTDPDPYVRSRWGFAEWIVGQEPLNAKQLLTLGYEIEGLDQLFEKLGDSIQQGPLYLEDFNVAKISREIEKAIHEMGQPLSSRQVMRFHAEEFLKRLEELNELGSFSPQVVDQVGKYLSQALRADWQYHVLHDFPLYHQLYAIHHGIIDRSIDLVHRQRLGVFRKIMEHLEQHIKNRETQKHSMEIDLDINDMKGYLQDFYASVQRLEKEPIDQESLSVTIKEMELQLLEYRHLFGNFFNQLPQSESEGKLLRNTFLFVDQYFESIENRLQDLKNRSELDL
ncbi:putative uncharacterized protein [Parachlamydia acanthamoebae UV-7]|jgi:hypothetical protein|uniref:Uncharacterized protein n=2 Tax=Parachlamydia acanthamoebae TaxID=83552 RepID=F8L203_PARAV|nr:hypothetical protein pah_c221o023 [Parachlamydia acanthamoebae str. Hall's coccus]KIA76997.1 hypothetical protein DB43_HA00160 [Parachlamydia acanthamoebae]CCB87317.1 putative uncharacterized protein [Parachlamydia acanthamoebae UV-7]